MKKVNYRVKTFDFKLINAFKSYTFLNFTAVTELPSMLCFNWIYTNTNNQ